MSTLKKLILVILVALIIVPLSAAATKVHHLYPKGWKQEALCIHLHESIDWHKTTTWNGLPERDHGGLQIDTGTWNTFVSRNHLPYPDDPSLATPGQQYFVAYLIWKSNGDRFGGNQWYYSAKACNVP